MKPWILWGLAGLALLGVALFGDVSTLMPDPPTEPTSSASSSSDSDPSKQTDNSDSASSTDEDSSDSEADSDAQSSPPSSSADASESATTEALVVNGEVIEKAKLDRAFRTFLESYQQSYADQGKDFEAALEGPSGAHLELQIRHQAAQSVVERTLIRQRAEARGLQVSPDKVEDAVRERFENFLDKHGVTEAQLQDIFQRPNSRRVAQRILGVRAASVEAIKERLRREERQRLLKKALIRDLTDTDQVDLNAEDTQERFREWLKTTKSDSEIVYHEPLLKAYHEESQISAAEELQEKLTRLEEAIAAYKAAKDQTDSQHLDYFLGQLYNLRVNWSSALRDQVREETSGNSGDASNEAQDAQAASEQLGDAIRESRDQATSLLSPFNIRNEEQLLRIMRADQDNPLFKYMYADYLVNKSDASRRSVAVRMLDRAIELNSNYVDAYVLFGDIRMDQSKHWAAIESYRQAVDAYDDAREQFRTVSKTLARRKLAAAHIEHARKLASNSDAADVEGPTQQQSLDQAQEILNDLRDQLTPQSTGYADVIAKLGEIAMLQARYGDAQARYQASLDVQESASVRVKLGDAYRAAEQWEAAERAYRQALDNTPGFARAHEGLARLYRERGQTQQAVEQFRLAFTRGDELDYQERRQVALEAFDLASDATELRIELAHFYLSQNVYEGALEQFRTVLEQSESEESSVIARLGMGRVHFQRLDYDKAEEQFRQALDRDPTPSQRIDILRWIVKTEQRRVGVGEPLPESGRRALWQLAQLYAETGQPDESFRTLMDIREDYPDFRPDKVQALIDDLSDSSDGDRQPGKETADQGHEIIEPGEEHGGYATTPPTSGPHYVIPADWGIHGQPIPDEAQLRNLAGGGVLIQYQPGLGDAEQENLRELVRALRQDEGRCRLVLAPYEDLDSPIVLTAWTRIDALSSYDAERIRDFVEAHAGSGPEVSEVGCSVSNS